MNSIFTAKVTAKTLNRRLMFSTTKVKDEYVFSFDRKYILAYLYRYRKDWFIFYVHSGSRIRVRNWTEGMFKLEKEFSYLCG